MMAGGAIWLHGLRVLEAVFPRSKYKRRSFARHDEMVIGAGYASSITWSLMMRTSLLRLPPEFHSRRTTRDSRLRERIDAGATLPAHVSSICGAALTQWRTLLAFVRVQVVLLLLLSSVNTQRRAHFTEPAGKALLRAVGKSA